MMIVQPTWAARFRFLANQRTMLSLPIVSEHEDRVFFVLLSQIRDNVNKMNLSHLQPSFKHSLYIAYVESISLISHHYYSAQFFLVYP